MEHLLKDPAAETIDPRDPVRELKIRRYLPAIIKLGDIDKWPEGYSTLLLTYRSTYVFGLESEWYLLYWPAAVISELA